MIDEEFNPNHCSNCTAKCGDCQDAFKRKGGIKGVRVSRFLVELVPDEDGYQVIRYAQRKAMEFLLSLLPKAGAA